MTLTDFITDERERLSKFEAWWKEQNAIDPENFPLEFDESNSGAWSEQFTLFDQ